MWQLSWSILCDTALYVLVGFFVAGLMRMWLPGGWAVKWLSQRRPRSSLLATLVGAPLPLCSCSVLPAAISLRRSGASKGATLSFLISTPETSVTSVLLTYSLLGPLMAIARPVAACVTAVTAGLIENFFDRRDHAAPPTEDGTPRCDCGEPSESANDEQRAGFRDAMRFAFVDLFDDIFMWIVIGVIVAAAIQTFVPPAVFQRYLSHPALAMFLMLVVGVPLYICAESSTPIAAALIAQGMNPGAALVLLLAGPATNLGAVGVLWREMGRRTVIIYLSVISVVTLLMGYIVDLIVAAEGVPLNVRAFGEPLVPLWVKNVGAATFVVMGVFTIARRRYIPRLLDWADRRLPVPVTPRSVSISAIVVALAAYGLSGITCVQPGERGVLKRFGRVVRSDLAPGLHFAWPWPIEQIERIAIERVYRLVLGYRVSDGKLVQVPPESLTLVGDENIADIKAALHWRADPDSVERFAYSTADRRQLVRNVTLAALREVLGGESINWGFTRDRAACQQRILELVRRRLADYDVGIRVDSFHFLDAHAPAEVHAAFRDVAGALEDRATQINLALAREARLIPQARGEAAKYIEQARGYAARAVAGARGEAARFLALLDEYRRWPEVTGRRLYLEVMERVLPGKRKYLRIGDSDEAELDIWLIDSGTGASLPWRQGGDVR